MPSDRENPERGSDKRLRVVSYLTCQANASLGSAYVALGFAEQLRERGHVVEILEPAQYEPFPSFGRAVFYRQSLGMLVSAMNVLRRRQRDVLIFYGGSAWLAVLALTLFPRAARPIVVIHSNGLEPFCAARLRDAAQEGGMPRRRWFQMDLSGLTSIGFRRADGLVVVSEYEAEYASAHSWPRGGRLISIENPLPESYLGVPPSGSREKVVGFCGSWIARKGIERMRREIPSFLRRNEGWRFRILGAESDYLLDEFPEDLRERIELVPLRDRDKELAREYDRLAILVSPSVYESFGLVVSEAMARGCAVVAARVGFAAGLKDREEALLCDPEEPGVLAAALEELARDAEMRTRIALGGWARVQSLRWEPAGERLERVLSAWLAELRNA